MSHGAHHHNLVHYLTVFLHSRVHDCMCSLKTVLLSTKPGVMWFLRVLMSTCLQLLVVGRSVMISKLMTHLYSKASWSTNMTIASGTTIRYTEISCLKVTDNSLNGTPLVMKTYAVCRDCPRTNHICTKLFWSAGTPCC